MISRRSRCPAIRAANRSRSGVGKYRASTSVVQASSTSSSASTSRSKLILTYARSTANSGAVSPSPASCRAASSLSVGSASSSRLSWPVCSSSVEHPAVHRQQRVRLRPGVAERGGLLVVVPQHQRGDLVGHRGQQLVAVRHGQLAVGHRAAEQDLDVDLVVGAVHPGRVVDEVGEDPAAGAGELDPAALGQAQVAALADHLDPQVAAVHPDRVVGLVADVGVRSRWPPSRRCRCRRSTADRPARPGSPASARPGSPPWRRRGRAPRGPAARPGWTWPYAGTRRRPR